MKLYVFCPRDSEGAHDLVQGIKDAGMDCLRIKDYHGQQIMHGPVINWGCGEGGIPPISKISAGKLWNKAEAIYNSCSKIRTYQNLLEHDVWTVAMTQREQRAKEWLASGRAVYARTDWGSNGVGIQIVRPGEFLPPSSFYSRHFPSTHEIRVHVAFGAVIDMALKVERVSDEWKAQERRPDNFVRNFKNGWRLTGDFGHEEFPATSEQLTEIGDIAMGAIKANGLDFGAVDMLANLDPQHGGQRFLTCETNSAPALELDKTIESYAKAFIRQAQA